MLGIKNSEQKTSLYYCIWASTHREDCRT